MKNIFNELVGITIKETDSIDSELMYVDFRFDENEINNNWELEKAMDSEIVLPNLILPNGVTKKVTLEIKEFDNKEHALKTITGEFIDLLRKNAYQNLTDELNASNIFTVSISSDVFVRRLITKVDASSNYIATEGRIGPGTMLLVNPINAILLLTNLSFAESIKDIEYDINEEVIMRVDGKVKGITIISDSRINENELLLTRKNQIDQPGISCFWMPSNVEKELIYKFIETGFYPHKQSIVVNITE